jgi:hypothetical protein
MRRSYLLAAAVIVAALSTASLLAGIRHALGKRETAEPELTPLEAERRRIREAMGDLLAPPIDFNNWPERLRPTPDMPDRDTLRKSMPKLDPPLSQTIREERDESRY